MSTVFVDNPDEKMFLFQKLPGCKHSNCSPHFIWTNSGLDWKIFFVKLHTETFIRAKFDNDMSTFFVDNPDQTLFLFQNLPVCIHFYSSPHSIWTSPWIDWKTLFVKLHSDTFLSAKFNNDMSTVFVDNTDHNFFLFQKLLGCKHSNSSPHFICTNSWLDWRILFVRLHSDIFERKIWQRHDYFFRRQPRSTIPIVSETTIMDTVLL